MWVTDPSPQPIFSLKGSSGHSLGWRLLVLPCITLSLKYISKTLCVTTPEIRLGNWRRFLSNLVEKGLGAVNQYWHWDGQTTMSEKLLMTSLKLCLTNPSLGPRWYLPEVTMAWTYCPSAWEAPQNVAVCRNRKQVQLRLHLQLPSRRSTAKSKTAGNKENESKTKQKNPPGGNEYCDSHK